MTSVWLPVICHVCCLSLSFLGFGHRVQDCSPEGSRAHGETLRKTPEKVKHPSELGGGVEHQACVPQDSLSSPQDPLEPPRVHGVKALAGKIGDL